MWRVRHAASDCARTPNIVTSAVPPPKVSGDAAKYRQVTVLFADAVRSTDLAAAVDMERLCVEFLARTGLRKSVFLVLTVDSVVQIGAAYWLHYRWASCAATATLPCTRN